MKISLKITKEATGVLCYYFSRAGEAQPRNRRQRVQLSIMKEVAVKMERYYANLQPNKKWRKINFKAYEADMIEQYLSSFVDVVDDVYSRIIIQKVIAEINQQLA
ncbi:hypothetical protein [Capnocytophaga canis]|uniref:hypothetical protein n=1 Tax=Capnocytophaga canis TaxID=1848903 RepID=UPI001561F3DC|nr:hypothetical protein [Capnocytophaga canis]